MMDPSPDWCPPAGWQGTRVTDVAGVGTYAGARAEAGGARPSREGALDAEAEGPRESAGRRRRSSRSPTAPARARLRGASAPVEGHPAEEGYREDHRGEEQRELVAPTHPRAVDGAMCPD